MFPKRLRKRLLALHRARRRKWAVLEMPPELHEELLDHLWMVAGRVRKLREKGWSFDDIAKRLSTCRDDPRRLWFVREREDLVIGARRASDSQIAELYYEEQYIMDEIVLMTGETRSHIVRALNRHRASTPPDRWVVAAPDALEKRICELRDIARSNGRPLSYGAIARIVTRQFDLEPPITRQRVHRLYHGSREASSGRTP